MAVQRSTPMDAPPTRLYGRNGRLLLLGLLVRTLLGQECELSGLVVPEHGVVNGFCAERRARAARLPDGEGCYISCDPGWIESGEQPRCSGGELRSSARGRRGMHLRRSAGAAETARTRAGGGELGEP